MTATGYILPATADLTVIVGADFSTQIQLFSDAAQSVPFDLTGYTATLRIGSRFTLTVGSGLTIATPANGTIVAALTHEQTGSVTLPNVGVTPSISPYQGLQTVGDHYSLQLTDATGKVSYPLSGGVTFTAP